MRSIETHFLSYKPNVGAHLGLFYLLALPELGLVSPLSALPKSRLSQSVALRWADNTSACFCGRSLRL